MKKITTLIFAVILMLACLCVTSHAQGSIASKDALNVINALNFYDELSKNTDDNAYVTRGEFCGILSKILNTEWNKSGESPFRDVNEAMPYYSQICMMNEMGIIIGDATGAFYPDMPVTYAQAVKCMVYLTGYSLHAEKLGGYPSGYFIKATELDMTDGVNYRENEAVSRTELAVLIYNSLDIPIMDIEAVGEKGLTYGNGKDDTILSRYHGIKKEEGILNAVDGRSILTREKVCGEGFAQIGNQIVKYSEEIAQYLGFNIEAYITDDTTPELLYAFPTADNEELMIKIGDLETEHPEFSLTQFRYITKTGKTQKAELTNELRFVYNGVYDLDFTVSDLDFATGYVSFINNDRDSEYDVCMVWNYENYVYESGSENIIRCCYNKSFKYDEDATYRVLSAEGAWSGPEGLSELSQWDVLSVAASKDLSLFTVYVNRSGIAGTVEGIAEDNGKTLVTIDGREYAVSDQYLNNAPNSGTVVIKPGLRSEFYFDIVGEIAAVYKVESADNAYGYILGAEKESKLSNDYKVKIFTEKGNIVLYKTGEKIKFTSEDVDSKSIKAEDVFNAFYEEEEFVPQVIVYTADENGIIKSIKKSIDATEQGYDLDYFSEDFAVGTIDGNEQKKHYRFQDATATFGMGETYENRFNINDSTIIMYVPKTGGKIAEDDMVIADAAMFINGQIYENFKIYDCDDTYNAKVMLYTPEEAGDGSSVKEEFFAAVEKVYTGQNEDGDFEPMVRVMYKGSEKVFPYVSTDGYIPEKGSILRCERKLTGELIVNRENIVYSPSQTTSFYNIRSFEFGGGTYLPVVWSQYGRIWRKNGNTFTVYTGLEKPRANYLLTGCTVYKINKEKEVCVTDDSHLTASTGNPGEIADGSLVVINNRYQYVREMWIIEEQ